MQEPKRLSEVVKSYRPPTQAQPAPVVTAEKPQGTTGKPLRLSQVLKDPTSPHPPPSKSGTRRSVPISVTAAVPIRTELTDDERAAYSPVQPRRSDEQKPPFTSPSDVSRQIAESVGITSPRLRAVQDALVSTVSRQNLAALAGFGAAGATISGIGLPVAPILGVMAAGLYGPQAMQQGTLALAESEAADRRAAKFEAAGRKQDAEKWREEAEYLRTHAVLAAVNAGLLVYGGAKGGTGIIDSARPGRVIGSNLPVRQSPNTRDSRRITAPASALPPKPPVRGGRVTADFVDKPPITYQPERTMLPDRVSTELPAASIPERPMLPPAPVTELPGGGVVSRGTNQGQPGGLGPKRLSEVVATAPGVQPRYRQARTAETRHRLLPPGPELELANGGGTMPRGTVQGEPGGLPARRRAEVIPTRSGVQPRYRDQKPVANVLFLQAKLEKAEKAERDLARLVDNEYRNLKSRTPPDHLRSLVRMQQNKRAEIRDLRTQLAIADKPQGRMETPSAPAPIQEAPLPPKSTIELRGGPEAPTLGTSESEALTIAARGRRPELLKEGRTFDESRVVGSPLFQGRGGRQRLLSEQEPDPVPATPYEAALEDATISNMKQIAETFQIQAASNPITGSGAQRSITGTPRRIIDPNTGAVIQTEGRFGGGGKDMFGLSHIPESPLEIARAIEGGNGALYERVKAAVRQMTESEHGEQIARYAAEAPDADSFNFGPETGAFRLGVLRPIHNIRQLAYQFGERTGQPVVDAIASRFNQYSPRIVRQALGTGEYKRPARFIQYRRERGGTMQRIAEETEIFRDALIQAMPDHRSRVLAKKIATNEATPEDMTAAMKDPNILASAEYVRQTFKDLAEQIIGQGVRQYSKLKSNERAAIISAMKAGRSIMDLPEELRPFAEKGIVALYGEYVPRLYKSKEAQPVLRKYGLTGKRIREDLTRLKERNIDLSPEVRKALGEIEEIAFPAIKGVFQERKLLADNAFFRKIADDPELTARDAKTAPGSFQQLPEVETLGPLAGKWVHPSVHYDLMQMVTAPGEVMRYFQKINRFVKANKTTRNPATHFRNIESNYFLRDIGGMDFVDQLAWDIRAIGDYAKKTERFKEARDAGLFGNDFVYAELDGLNWEALSAETEKGIAAPATFTAKLLEALKTVDDGMSKAYRLEDDIPKLAMYSWLRSGVPGMGKGLSPREAVTRVYEVMPDYSDVSPLVDSIRRNPLGPTFITFTAKVLPSYARALIKHPLRAGKYIVLGEIARQIASGWMNESDEEQQREVRALPEYMQPKLGGLFTPFAKLPARDRFDRKLFYDLTYALPAIGDLGETTGMFGLPPMFSIGILPQTAIEIATNQNWYASTLRGRPTGLWNERTDTGTEKFLKGSQHLGAQLLPSLTPGVGYGARRLQSAFTGKPNYYGDVQDVAPAVLHAVFGQRVVPVDLTLEERKQLITLQSDIRALDEQMASVRRDQSTSGAKKEVQIRILQNKKKKRIEEYRAR